jgi:hypothetical protein
MSDAVSRPVDRAEAIANYKRILRTYIDRRPSGTRQKIALTLAKATVRQTAARIIALVTRR